MRPAKPEAVSGDSTVQIVTDATKAAKDALSVQGLVGAVILIILIGVFTWIGFGPGRITSELDKRVSNRSTKRAA